MPSLEGAPAYLIDYLFEIGPVSEGGMGAAALTFVEIDAFCRLTGVRFRPWEVRLLKKLSREYVKQLHDDSQKPPWQAPDEKPRPTASQLAIRALANL